MKVRSTFIEVTSLLTLHKIIGEMSCKTTLENNGEQAQQFYFMSVRSAREYVENKTSATLTVTQCRILLPCPSAQLAQSDGLETNTEWTISQPRSCYRTASICHALMLITAYLKDVFLQIFGGKHVGQMKRVFANAFPQLFTILVTYNHRKTMQTYQRASIFSKTTEKVSAMLLTLSVIL